MKQQTGPIAVVGMSGIFPGATDTQFFFDNIINKRSSIRKVPESRWKAPESHFLSRSKAPDTAVSANAGIIEDFNFNPDGFRVEKAILNSLDPVHKLALQAGRQAFMQCVRHKDAGKRTGVILAAIALPTDASNEISRQILFGDRASSVSALDLARSSMVGFPASILCRALGLEAGCFTLDAACASSLFAIKLACENLNLKKADIIIAGGVSRPDCLYTQIGFTQLSALSPSGICAPFDRNADGLVVGEGVGLVTLKRLEDAVNAGDTIHAVIRGYGVSNDIEGTLVGPASEGQIRAMNAAYKMARLTPADIQYMECHGSGTPVGDQVELNSIRTLLNQYDCPDAAFSIGSVKSMTGHLLTAAGAAGFIKTVMGMTHETLPPSLNFKAAPADSFLNQSRVKVQTEPEEWAPGDTTKTRAAGVSAFGFGGINAHLVIEGYQHDRTRHFVPSPPEQKVASTVPCAIVGMNVISKTCRNLSDFQDIIFNKKQVPPEPPGSRSRISDTDGLFSQPGFFLDELETFLGEFHIPPNQLDDILPQHLVLLKSARQALLDAGIRPRPEPGELPRNRMGAAIGIDFDFGATDFRMRWNADTLGAAGLDQISPPLDFNRTLGALGGIVASRVAREFKLGGPCFTLSGTQASGIKAIETAVHSLSGNETDVFICGCVDLCGDIRQLVLNKAAGQFSQARIPGEGAASIVVKRLDAALRDKDTVYAVIDGTNTASGAFMPGEPAAADTENRENIYEKTLGGLLDSTGNAISNIGLFEADVPQAGFDVRDLIKIMRRKWNDAPEHGTKCRLSHTAGTNGAMGAASAMISVIKSALCLFNKRMPANKDLFSEAELSAENNNFSISDKPVDWPEAAAGKKRCALVSSVTVDGQITHLLLHADGHAASPRNKKDDSRAFNQSGVPKEQLTIKINKRRIPEPHRKKISELMFNAGLIQDSSVPVPPRIPGAFDPLLISRGTHATAKAHEKFLEFSNQTMKLYEKQFETLARMAGDIVHGPQTGGTDDFETARSEQIQEPAMPSPPMEPALAPLLDRDKCLEFAVGKAGNVLGEAFDEIDAYPVRVRLPGEPLMLVDRIMSIEGEMLSMTRGKIVTQHDVKENAWYLDGPKAPVSISIEAGQADLFLCAWLGIDHQVKGTRKYRLLDAKVTFHRTLPEAGETIEYHIEIDRFLKQGPVYLFFFHYKGYIDDRLFISMRDGCAGFFNEEEVENSGGIILKNEDLVRVPPRTRLDPFVPVEKLAFSDARVEALRKGDLGTAFGKDFEGITLGKQLRLPGGRMHLIDRVLEFDPGGGRFGLGRIVAQADIHPDDWFLTCHFIDDMVMPGTLMYECCAHALRIFTQRIGWISTRDDVFYDVVTQNESDLKCRGPVTTGTKKARYEIEIKEIGYGPNPFVIADAHMFSDDLRIVLYKDMGMRVTGLTLEELQQFWRNR